MRYLFFIILLVFGMPVSAAVDDAAKVFEYSVPADTNLTDAQPAYIPQDGQKTLPTGPSISNESDGDLFLDEINRFEISTKSPLDMSWNAFLEINGTELKSFIENTFLPDLPFKGIQNLEVKYKIINERF